MTALDSWIRNVRAVLGGARILGPVRLGRTPATLIELGLPPSDLSMFAGKIVLVRKEHPEIAISILGRLPVLLADPQAAFEPRRADGSLIIVVDALDDSGQPVIVPIIADPARDLNVILSVYGKAAGLQWIAHEIESARRAGQRYYLKKGFADAGVCRSYPPATRSNSGRRVGET